MAAAATIRTCRNSSALMSPHPLQRVLRRFTDAQQPERLLQEKRLMMGAVQDARSSCMKASRTNASSSLVSPGIQRSANFDTFMKLSSIGLHLGTCRY